jgi:Ca2+-binding EF-hand superfamily protein
MQLASLRSLFRLYDLDGSGEITTQEMQGVLSSFGHSPAAHLLNHFTAFADMNGTFSYHDFCYVISTFFVRKFERFLNFTMSMTMQMTG